MENILQIDNLKCEGCTTHITKELSKLPNISELKVDVHKNTVSFQGDQDCQQLARTKLHNLGYPVAGTEQVWMQP